MVLLLDEFIFNIFLIVRVVCRADKWIYTANKNEMQNIIEKTYKLPFIAR